MDETSRGIQWWYRVRWWLWDDKIWYVFNWQIDWMFGREGNVTNSQSNCESITWALRLEIQVCCYYGTFLSRWIHWRSIWSQAYYWYGFTIACWCKPNDQICCLSCYWLNSWRYEAKILRKLSPSDCSTIHYKITSWGSSKSIITYFSCTYQLCRGNWDRHWSLPLKSRAIGCSILGQWYFNSQGECHELFGCYSRI